MGGCCKGSGGLEGLARLFLGEFVGERKGKGGGERRSGSIYSQTDKEKRGLLVRIIVSSNGAVGEMSLGCARHRGKKGGEKDEGGSVRSEGQK